MSSPFLSGRIPESLYDAIEAHRQQTNQTKTGILIQALSAYIQNPNGALEARVAALEAKFEALEEQVEILKRLLAANRPGSVIEQDETGQLLLIPGSFPKTSENWEN